MSKSLVVASFVGFVLVVAGCSARRDGARRGERDSGPPPFDTGPAMCTDSDGDTICDRDEGTNDTDGDGTADYRDSDSDNDGVSDRDEAGDADLETPPRDSNGDGIPDYADPTVPGSGMDAGALDDAPMSIDAGTDSQIVEELCPASSRVDPGCLAPTEEGPSSLCDGLDNDCDGEVDERCGCTPGAVQRCFLGPPGSRDVGACTDGLQLCQSMGEFGGVWGPCQGGVRPQDERCDDLDNDCNGCTDEVVGCVPVGSCPGPGDPRVPEGRPFSTYALHGADFYPGADAMSWQWSVVGTPCDRMFQAIPGSTATSDNGQLSYRLRNGNMRDASLEFTLSGDYEVTLRVTRMGGEVFECTWVVKVRAPGVRVELCWDATGPTASRFGGTVDVDLHLGKVGTTTAWFTPQDCYYATCDTNFGSPSWTYPSTPIGSCTGPGARGSFTGSCPNPRLDIDNIATTSTYVPENINVDNPSNGDDFRVMVHHYTSTTRETRPLVNVYCGGELKGTYGAHPDVVTSFDRGGGDSEGDMWRVVDIEAEVDATGVTTGCNLTPLHPPGMSSGYWITLDDPSF